MTRAETRDTSPRINEQAETGIQPQESFVPGQSLRDSVSIAVRQYLNELDGQMAADVYDMVLAEVEAPLLKEVMAYTRNNQTKASIMLGLNRGTLRKKLKQYKLISSKD